MRSTASSRLMPPDVLPPLGLVSMMICTASCTCRVRKVRSAFGWRPNSSGLSCAGSSSIACSSHREAQYPSQDQADPEVSSAA